MDTQPEAVKKRSRRDIVWTFSTYFSEGFPYSIIRTVSSVFFRDMKVSLENIGLTSLYGLPWTLKFLWSPLIGETSTRRRWMLSMQAILVGIIVAAACLAPQKSSLTAIALLFFIGAIFAATQDIAIDGYYMEALNKDDQAKWVGYRVMAYRIAWMTGPGVIAAIGMTAGWFLAFAAAALLYGAFFVYHLFFLKELGGQKKKFFPQVLRFMRPRPLLLLLFFCGCGYGIFAFFNSQLYEGLQKKFLFLKKLDLSHWVGILLLLALAALLLARKKIKSWLIRDRNSFYTRAFLAFIDREKIAVVLVFIAILRSGEYMLTAMVSPFIIDLGIRAHYSWISGYVGFPASILGAMLGGWVIARTRLKKIMWPFLLAQNLTNLIYMLLALHLGGWIQINQGAASPTPIGLTNLILVAGVHGIDQFASGLGNALLITFLMRLCHRQYQAAHYAIGSGLFAVGGLFAGVASGFLASWLGYAWLFAISFLIAIPGMLLIPFLPDLSQDNR